MPESGELARRAEALAVAAHAGQTDKAGRPYIEHPARVAVRVAPCGDEAVAVAWLHDVAEDTEVSLGDLREAGFPEHVVSAVDALTKRSGEPLADYCGRVAANRLALLVKTADLADNSDPQRLALLDPRTRARLEAKYARARRLLGLPERGSAEHL